MRIYGGSEHVLNPGFGNTGTLTMAPSNTKLVPDWLSEQFHVSAKLPLVQEATFYKSFKSQLYFQHKFYNPSV